MSQWHDGTQRPEASFPARSMYLQAIEQWGGPAQSDMLVEEVGELLAALNQYRRGRITLDELAGEVADVRIMLAQLEEVTGMVSSGQLVVEKLDRLARRLEADRRGKVNRTDCCGAPRQVYSGDEDTNHYECGECGEVV